MAIADVAEYAHLSDADIEASPSAWSSRRALPSAFISRLLKAFVMSGPSKSHGRNNSRSTESDWDEIITIIVIALAKGLGVLAWSSILIPVV